MMKWNGPFRRLVELVSEAVKTLDDGIPLRYTEAASKQGKADYARFTKYCARNRLDPIKELLRLIGEHDEYVEQWGSADFLADYEPPSQSDSTHNDYSSTSSFSSEPHTGMSDIPRKENWEDK